MKWIKARIDIKETPQKVSKMKKVTRENIINPIINERSVNLMTL